MSNALFAFPNYCDAQLSPSTTGAPTILTPTFSGGSWAAATPLTNLATSRLYELARSTDALAASTQFDVDLQTARAILCCALVRHNLSQTATFRIRGSNTPGVFTSPVYDSGTLPVFAAALYAPGSLPWGYPPVWSGAPTAEDLAYYKSLAFVHVMPSLQTARYWRIELTDTGNGNGFVQLGRVVLAPGFVPRVNIAYGATLGWTTKTASQPSEAGVDFFRATPQRRVLTVTLEDLPLDQALEFIHDMQGRLGKEGQLVCVFDPADTYHLHRRSFLATLTDLDPLTYAYFGTNSAPVRLTEVL